MGWAFVEIVILRLAIVATTVALFSGSQIMPENSCAGAYPCPAVDIPGLAFVPWRVVECILFQQSRSEPP
jgi:hypothetical protein